MAKRKIVLRGRIQVNVCSLPQEPLFRRCCTSSSLLFLITFLGLLVHCEAASGFLRQQFHIGSNMRSAKGCIIRYVICSERTNDEGSVLCSVNCVCTVYHVVEIFRFSVNVQSQTIMITDF